MANHSVTCRQCGNKIKSDKATKHPEKKRFYFCSQDCLRDYEDSDPNVSNKTDEQKLNEYLEQLYGKDQINFPMLKTQIKRLMDSEGFKPSGILLTLQYCYETLGFVLDKEYGIERTVLSFYEKAKRNWVDTQELKERYADFEEDEIKIMKTSPSRDKNEERKQLITPM